MAKFDDKGDLWIDVEVDSLPKGYTAAIGFMRAVDTGWGVSKAVTAFNLTEYICKLTGVARR